MDEAQFEGIVTAPGIIVDGLIPIPNSIVTIILSSETDKSVIREVMSKDEENRDLLLFAVKDPVKRAEGNLVESLSSVAVLCDVFSYTEKNGSYFVDLYMSQRCNIVQFGNLENIDRMAATVEIKLSRSEDVEEEANTARLIEADLKLFSKYLDPSEKDKFYKGFFNQTPDVLADIIIYNFGTDEEKIEALESFSIAKRLLSAGIIIKAQLMNQAAAMEQLDAKIDETVSKNMLKTNREYYLQEKIKVIQEELGNKAIQDAEVIELKKKILDAHMPKETEEKALSELRRYTSMSGNLGEASVVKSYLDFLVELPWDKTADEQTDIIKATEQLNKDHYGLEKIKERILEYLAVYLKTGKKPQSILCLVGPPGVGKTSLAYSVAKALNKPFIKEALGGVKDEAEIRGHRKTYLGAMPGRILYGMKKAKVNNPVFLFDEIDKMSSDYRGDPASAMLEVLDPEQNKVFIDHYLEEPFDLSNVFFICTANYIDNIPPALKDRMEIIELSSYTEVEKLNICKSYLIPKQLEVNGLTAEQFTITDDAIYKLIREYTFEAGVRELERLVSKLIRRTVKQMLEDAAITEVHINTDNLTSSIYLGKEKYTFNKIDDQDAIGTVTGLAYTQAGGDTLPIEAIYYTGKESLQLTGKLGDVMKESATCAYSWVRAHAHDLQIDSKLFEENTLHLHFPEGAIPKDGPSAGVAITTAITSAFTNRPVDRFVGMTGEINLRGKVTAIGGLREKSIAAHKSGLKKILIPKDNLKDLDDVPDIVKQELEIIPISTINEALQIALK